MDGIQPQPIQLQGPGTQEAWDLVTGQLRSEISRALYQSWVEPLQPLSYQEGVFTIGARNPYGRDLAESRLKSRITRILEGVYGNQVDLKVVVNNGLYKEGQRSAPAPVISEETVTLPVEEVPNKPQLQKTAPGNGSRKVVLQRAYGSERARVIQPERGMFVTLYMFNNWLPLIGHSAFAIVLAARSMCYWNPITGELRNVIETDMGEIAARASVSVRTVKTELASDLIKKYFMRYRVRRIMTVNGIRTAGISLMVRMDDPLTPADQEKNHLAEEERWYPAEFEDETEED